MTIKEQAAKAVECYLTMPFGKYKGMSIDVVAGRYPDYIVWLHDKCQLSGKLKTKVQGLYLTAVKGALKKPKRRMSLGDDNYDPDYDPDNYADYDEYGLNENPFDPARD